MIETKRLTLRPFNGDDLDIIAKLYSDEEIMAYMPIPVLDKETAQKLMKWQLFAKRRTKKSEGLRSRAIMPRSLP